jgi:tetratricopeptide (TPR) repeat protein
MRTPLLILITAVALSTAATAQQQIPPESLDKLQDVLATVRDRLWEANERYWHEGEFERCIAALRLIAEIDPHDVEAYINGAWMIQNEDRDAEAEVFLRRGLANNPDSPDILFELGYFCYMRWRFDDAIAYLEQAAAYDMHWRVWNLLAHAYERAGNVEETLNIWFMLEERERDTGVPELQISHILSGEPPSSVPEMERHTRGNLP